MMLVLAFVAASVTIPACAITYVGDVGTVSSNAAGTTLPIPVGAAGVAAGNTIVVGFASRGASPYNVPTVSDTVGNTYTLATNAITYQHGRSYIYFAHVNNALANGNKITITTSSVSNRVAVASVFSGLLDANLLDKTLGNPTGTSTTAQGNNPTVGPTATTFQASELIIGVIGTEEATDAGVGTWQNGFTTGPQVKSSSATTYDWRVSLGYQIVSATGQFTAAKTVANNPYWAASIATFKAGAAPDTDAPTPNPATFAVAPMATGPTVVTMTAMVGTDATGPVEYFFTETSSHPGGSSSGWQTNQTYVNTGLNPSTTYSYTVTMRDALANTGTASTVASVTTPANAITYVGDVGSVSSNALGTNLDIAVGAGGVAAGNTIVVGFASRGATTYNTPVVADSAANTYTLATNAITYGHGRSYIYFAHVKNALANGNKITITTSSVSNRVAVASVFSGLLDTNLLDKALANPVGTSTSTNGNNPSVGPTATTVQANELIIGVIGTEEATNAGVGTWQNSFTAGPQIKTSGTSTNEWRVSLGYQIVSANGQFTASKVVSNTPYWAASLATFRASSAPLPDTNAPVITTCATNRTINAGANCQAAIPDMTPQVVASDDSGSVTITQSPVAGTLVGLGNTVVTLTVSDAATNQATCQATITVVDVTPPSITTCATNRTINAGANCQAAIPDLTSQVVASDCNGVTITQSPVAGTLVGLGNTVVTLTVKDAANNQATCQATITVVDGNVPNITAQPQSTTNLVGTTATFTVTAASCSSVEYQWMFGTNVLSNENAATLTITNVQTSHAGDYTVVLTNAAGSITSAVATLTVQLPASPTLSASPMLLSNGHFYAGFTGTPNVSYTVKYADDVFGPWQTLTNIASDVNGLIEIDDILADAPAKRFYRIVYP